LLTSARLFSLYLFFFYCSRPPRDPHPFPTRRSSDLGVCAALWRHGKAQRLASLAGSVALLAASIALLAAVWEAGVLAMHVGSWRSEEHTSELQSRENLVCRLLLEKKNKNQKHSGQRE